MKPLNQSDYKAPNWNPRVIKDKDPLKSFILNQAKSRYDADVAKRKQANEQLIESHWSTVKRDLDQIRFERSNKKYNQEVMA